MAKQYKKLQNKVYPKKKADDSKPQEKIGKDYLLLGIAVHDLCLPSCQDLRERQDLREPREPCFDGPCHRHVPARAL